MDQLQYEIFKDVAAERDKQDAKWGPQSNHTLDKWSAILGEEYGEVCKAILDYDYDDWNSRHDLREELIQTIAVATHIVELLDLHSFKG